MVNGSYRDLHKDNGDGYASSFVERRYRAAMWALEQEVLDELLNEHFATNDINALDFACGTGRVLRFVSKRVRFVTGIDIAKSMLDSLHKDAPTNSKILQGDLTLDDSALKGQQFDLITAFRFFPNAEPELRDQAFAALKRLLKPGGLLVFNNHQNQTAPVRIVGTALGFMKARNMHREEVYTLTDKHGFSVVDEVGLGALPLHDRFMPLTSGFVVKLERHLAKRKLSRLLGQNVIFSVKPYSTG